MTDEQLFLAAAYVDDELTLDERVRAENDPVVWAEVQRQRSVQQLATAVPAYSHDVERAQIARAIAAATDQPTGQPTGLAKVDDLTERRQRRNRWLGGSIAAGVALAVAGVAFVSVRGGSNDTSAGDAAPATVVEDAAAMESAESAAAATVSADAGEAADTTVDEGQPSAAGNAPPVAAQLEDTSPARFSTADELVDVGRLVIAQTALSLLDPPEPDCEIITESGESLPPLADAILVGADETPVLLAVEPLDDLMFQVIVADAEDCSILMSASGSLDR